MRFSLLLLVYLWLGPVVSAQSTKHILVFGDSITAGLGVEPQQAFPALIQLKADSLQPGYKVINAGLSGETSAGGLRRIDWVLQRPAELVILELGGNDALRGIDLSSTKENLQQIINKIKAKYPAAQILLAGMQAPPNLGTDYTRRFEEIYHELADENGLPLIPFLLEGVGGIKALNQPDGIHPNIQGHRIVAETVWKYLQPLLEQD